MSTVARSPVFAAWHRMVFETPREDGRLPPEVEAEWETLRREHLDGERLKCTAVDDAGILCVLGWHLAMQGADYRSALARAERYLEHPDCDRGDRNTLEFLLICIAGAKWCLGEEASALADCRRLLDRRAPYHRSPLLLVRNALYSWSQLRDAEERAPECFSGLAAEVLAQFPAGKRLASGVRQGANYGELEASLAQTLGPTLGMA